MIIPFGVFVIAPAFLFLYGIAHFVDGLDGSYGPGFAWTVGHLMFLCALIMFGAIIVELWRRVAAVDGNRFLAGSATAIGIIGLAIFVRIAVIDIITGLRASDHAAMGAISSQLNNYPLPSLVPFYNVGPLLFQIGLLVLMLQLVVSKPRQLPWWSPIVLLGGFLLLGFDINLLIPGAILIGLAFVPLYQGK
jgi:hypothetical protein